MESFISHEIKQKLSVIQRWCHRLLQFTVSCQEIANAWVHTFFSPPPALHQTGPDSQNRINISLGKYFARSRRGTGLSKPAVEIFLFGLKV